MELLQVANATFKETPFVDNTIVGRDNYTHLKIYIGTLLLFLVGLYYLVEKGRFKKNTQKNNVINSLPGPQAIPFLGNIHQLVTSKDIVDLLLEWSKLYSPCYRLKLGMENIVFLTSPEAVEKLLGSNDNGHLSKSDHYSAMSDYLDEGLITSSGDKWRLRRKLLSPLFNYKCFPGFLEVFNRHSKLLVQNIADMFQHDEEPKPVQNAVFESMLRIICETSMGVELNDKSEEFDKFFVDAERCKHFIWMKSTIPWFKVDWIWKIHPFRLVYEQNVTDIKDYMFKVIHEARKNFEAVDMSNNVFKTAMHLMLAKNMPDSDIREEAHTIISAGHETTAASIQFALLLLALYPEHQKRCQEEIDKVYADQSKCPEGDFTMSAISDLKYVGRCAKEALRIFPIANVTLRKLTTPLQIASNLILPPGTSVAIAATNLHRNPRYFPNPDTFDPDRFTAKNSITRNPYAYIPFSGGPRICLGSKYAIVQMKLVLARILYNFNVTTTDGINTVRLEPSVVLTPVRGYNFVFAKRHQ